jgi:carboxyl-terminal processing protease
MAVAAQSRDAFSAVVKRVTGELYDSHTNLLNGPDGTPRVPPFDLIVDRGGRVTAVQADSAAADAGLTIGDTILAVEGVPIEMVARALAPQCLRGPDPAAGLWAVNAAVSGNRGRPRKLTARSGVAAPYEVAIPIKQRAALPDVDGRLFEDGIGLITIRSFGDQSAVAAFDAELARMAEARALIIDVRGNGGGDTAVARPIMGRFITARAPYARMRRRAGEGPERGLDRNRRSARALHLRAAGGGARRPLEREHGGGISDGNARAGARYDRRHADDGAGGGSVPRPARPHRRGGAIFG